MNKPTLFFSHSSKDKELILKLKDKLMSYTGSVLNIFMSSDGQSIPFGTNWIHKIEEGLNDARIMFVFVTNNSISSGWIYFEAGFAYSKNIHVIPVGIGIDIGALKAPLNLLQGFNLTSEDSLNNIISIVNKEFSYSFSEQFSRNDFDYIMSGYLNAEAMFVPFEEIVKEVSFSLSSALSKDNKTVYRENKTVFDKIESYLDENNIDYSKSPQSASAPEYLLSALGVIIRCRSISIGAANNRFTRFYLDFSISPYNFEKSFALYLKLNSLFEEPTQFYVSLSLNEHYSFVSRKEDYSALLLEYSHLFERDKEHVGTFFCKDLNLTFLIFDKFRGSGNHLPHYILNIIYSPDTLSPNSIELLVNRLIEAKVIVKDD